jgi:hypothetical protein
VGLAACRLGSLKQATDRRFSSPVQGSASNVLYISWIVIENPESVCLVQVGYAFPSLEGTRLSDQFPHFVDRDRNAKQLGVHQRFYRASLTRRR